MKTKKHCWTDFFNDWTLFEKTWLWSFFAINLYLFMAWHDTVVGLLASLTGMLCVVLVAKGLFANYYFGFANIFLYSYIAYGNKLYGEVILNMGFFLPLQFVGMYYWSKNLKSKKNGEVLVGKLGLGEKVLWIIASAIGTIAYGFFLRSLGAANPFADSLTTTLSIVATIMLTKRAKEQWLFWIVVNVISIYMWTTRILAGSGDFSMLVMWSAYLVNAVYGYVNWKRMEGDANDKDNWSGDWKVRTAA